jgi:hypothetical protein
MFNVSVKLQALLRRRPNNPSSFFDFFFQEGLQVPADVAHPHLDGLDGAVHLDGDFSLGFVFLNK